MMSVKHYFGRWMLAATVAALAACGGGSNNGAGSPFGGTGSGGGSSTAQVVSRLSLVLLNSNGAQVASLANNGSERITARVTALDANNTVVDGAPITLRADGGAEITPDGTVTGTAGTITAQVGIGADRSSRKITVTALAQNGTVTAATEFLVSGAKLTATAPPLVAPGAALAPSFTLLDASNNPMQAQLIKLSANGTEVGVQPTDSTGKTIFSFNAPATTGTLTLVASGAGETIQRVIQVQSSSVPVAVGTVLGASVAANPSVVSVNTTGTSNATTIRALFKGTGNAAIPNVRVWFTLPDPNSVGGTFSDNGLVYADSTGTATTTYIPGPLSSPTDGVIVLACYSNVDFVVPTTLGACPATASDGSAVKSTMATLTVVGGALRLSIGTDELIGLGAGTYIKDFVVVVVDAAGLAMSGVEITPKLDLTAFYKGFYAWNGSAWVRDAPFYGALQTPRCVNEDVNRNGIKESGEDTNGNGELDPNGVSITMVGSSKTDAAGKAIVRIEYPRDRATWIDYRITITGRVSGSEGLAVYNGSFDGLGNLPAPGEVFKNESVAPAFVLSPYGKLSGCDNAN
jgi:hypothetical protein